MPVAKLDTFREDIRQYLTIAAEIQVKITMEYVMNKAPEIAAIWPKVVENNEKLFKGEATLSDVWTVIAREEMLPLAGMLRHVFDQAARMRMQRNPLPQGIRIESADADGVPAEWQITRGAADEKVLLFLHGGGWVLGSSYSHRPLSAALGKATGMRVLSINYRLAPEHPFPAGLEDCTKAYQWLLRQGFKPSDIVIAGDSAGGNLTLATILKLREKAIPFPKGAVCFSPRPAPVWHLCLVEKPILYLPTWAFSGGPPHTWELRMVRKSKTPWFPRFLAICGDFRPCSSRQRRPNYYLKMRGKLSKK